MEKWDVYDEKRNPLTAMPRSLPPLSLPYSQSESAGGR